MKIQEIIAPKFQNLDEVAQVYHEQYIKASPFPNIYFDHFFDTHFLGSVLDEFPNLDEKKDRVYYKNPNEKKYTSRGEKLFGKNTQNMVYFLNSMGFLNFLNTLTGIKEPLISDPYFHGGGFHEIKKEGYLKLHVDFHRHQKTNLDRRINVLVYLNKDWKEEYGGHFELWEKNVSGQVSKILPLFNRMAIFSTTGNSWHGHPEPLTCPDNESRKSFALYYYSNGRPKGEISKTEQGRITTRYAHRKGVDKGKMKVYNSLVNMTNRVLPNSWVKIVKKIRNT